MTAASAAGLALLMQLASGCEQRRPTGPLEAESVVLLLGTRAEDPVWRAICAGARRFIGETTKIHLEEILPASNTAMAQKEAMDRMNPGNRPTVVCVLAIDAKLLIQPIKRLSTAGINVILIGDDAPKTGRRVFLGGDEAKIGRAILETLVGMLTEHRTLFAMYNHQASQQSTLRYEGFMEALQQQADLKLLRVHECGDDGAAALKSLYETSERYPGLGGWALLYDWFGTDLPADKPLVHGSARVVSYGVRPESLKLLEDGRVHALVGVDWEALGYRAMQTCYQFLTASTIPARDYRAPPIVVLPKDVDAYRKTWRRITAATASRPSRF
ncbi:MAG: substrate-binding domain-containing protein [Phycisphaerae bacterium]|nr:substrate-binding domain-containing protein [Phycisphaerae bacterium]